MADRNTKIRGNQIRDLTIENADIASDAAIAYSKLNLAGQLLNADVNASAAIAYSKLNLTGQLLNADVNASAAIAYSKLNLSTSIVDGDIAAGTISESKLDVNSAPADGKILYWNNSAGKLDYKDETVLADTLLEADIVKNEAPTGLINGSNAAYELANTPEAGSVEVFLNGILQEPGSGKDYQISGTTVTFAVAPDTGDIVLVCYFKSSD